MALEAYTFEKRMMRTEQMGYWLSLPDGYKRRGRERWPLILFLHGAGERGDDLSLVKNQGLPQAIDQGMSLPFITLAPQCPADSWWPDRVDALEALLAWTLSHYAIDTARLYLTGISMGGYGTWYFGCRHPDTFAALVPICGGGPWMYGFPERVCLIKHVPVWVFHGGQDKIVPPAESRRMVRELKACGGNVRLTIYPDAGHDSWTRTYHNPQLYEWLLAQKRDGGAGAP